MVYFSKFYGVQVRDEIAKEWTHSKDEVDDMMAGLHEIRARLSEEQKGLSVEGKVEKIRRDVRELLKSRGYKLESAGKGTFRMVKITKKKKRKKTSQKNNSL